jgi:eukaryotic-like serine/threonine-protein kinase
VNEILARLSAALADRYRIERELGGGGMSRVFLAEELALNRKVVVKVLPPALGVGVNVDRFRREILLAASLQHPHIVPVLAAGSADGLLYYTMPLVEGESLRSRLAREGELPVPETLRLLRDVADALAYAHEHGVLHRDIKPDNILISHQHALVTDFGVAKALSAAAGDGSSTTEGVALGTPAYMAPEQATADPHTDHRADLYALGIVAYEMLSGNTPFPGLSGQAALAAHATRRPTPIIELRPSIPGALAALVMRCLEKHPADRPQSANEVLQQLDLAATPSGGTAPMVALGQRSSHRGWQRWLLLGGAVAAVLALSLVALKRPRGSSTLDSNLLAVAPFDVPGGGLDVWREGLVDILSRNLDGAGSLKTVSPTVVIRRWNGRADPASAVALGHATGAALVVLGNVIAAAGDSLRLSASVLDVARDRTVAEVELRGRSDRMDQLTDSLTVGLLRELGRTRDVVAVRTATLRATSLPALKAFLEGERLYRNGRWDSAQAAYRQALAHDSLFVPALRHLGLSLSWDTEGENEFLTYMLRAGELNHGLPRRDSILVVGDSLMAALQLSNQRPLSSLRKLSDRLYQTLTEATRQYPGDPEVWYALGEYSYHNGWPRISEPADLLAPFDRAIALDSNFTPAFVHPTDLGLIRDGLTGWRRYAKPYLRLRPTDDFATGTRLVDAVFDAKNAAQADSLLRSARPDELQQALFAVWRFPDSAETGVQVARAFEATKRQPRGWAFSAEFRRDIHTLMLAFRGHLDEAERRYAERTYFIPSLPSEIALVTTRDPQVLEKRFRRLLLNGPLWEPGEPPGGGPPGELFFALRWWLEHRDTLSMKAYIRRVDSAYRAITRPSWRETTHYILDAASAYRTLSRGDSVAALRQFQSLPDDYIFGVMDRVTEGQLLMALKRDEEGIRVLKRAFPPIWISPLRTLAQLYIARAGEQIGQRDQAIEAYHRVAATWQHADPELQHYVDEARQGLARLTSEPRR